MAFHRRELLNDSLDPPIPEICSSFCNPENNRDGFCPILCVSSCYPTCNRSILSEILPSPPPPPPPDTPIKFDGASDKPYQLSLFLTVSLAILATTFFFFSCYTVYKFYKNRSRSRRRAQQQPHAGDQGGDEDHDDFLDQFQGPEAYHPIWYIRTVGLQSTVINAITVCKYKKGEGLIEGTECSVCLNEFEEDETLRLLPKCNHAFHIPCIDTWLGSHTNCPMCRAPIVIIRPTNSPAPEPVVQYPRLPAEEVREGSSESETNHNTENERERDEESGEFRVSVMHPDGLEDPDASRSGRILQKDGGCSGSRGCGDDVQPLRRSVSLDSLSASLVSIKVASGETLQIQSDIGRSNSHLVKMNDSSFGVDSARVDSNKNLGGRLVGSSSSMQRTLQKDPASITRSLSCSAKLLLSRYTGSRRFVLPS